MAEKCFIRDYGVDGYFAERVDDRKVIISRGLVCICYLIQSSH